MIRIESTIRNDNRIPFSTGWTGIEHASPKAKPRDTGLVRDVPSRELNLNGSQLVAGCVCLLGAANFCCGPFSSCGSLNPSVQRSEHSQY